MLANDVGIDIDKNSAPSVIWRFDSDTYRRGCKQELTRCSTGCEGLAP
jgi:hypothetical protein